jgi:hypothetical protein
LLPHSPYSPDLAPADFFLSRRWSCSWKVAIFTPLPRSSANRRLPHTWSQKHQSNNSQCYYRDVSWHTDLSRLKVTIAVSTTLCCHLLVHYRANPETFWYTLVCIVLCVTLTYSIPVNHNVFVSILMFYWNIITLHVLVFWPSSGIFSIINMSLFTTKLLTQWIHCCKSCQVSTNITCRYIYLQVLNALCLYIYKLRGFSPLANYTDRAIAAGQRS